MIVIHHSEEIAKTSTSLQLSVSDMLTHVNFPTFAMADRRYCGLIRCPYHQIQVFNQVLQCRLP